MMKSTKKIKFLVCCLIFSNANLLWSSDITGQRLPEMSDEVYVKDVSGESIFVPDTYKNQVEKAKALDNDAKRVFLPDDQNEHIKSQLSKKDKLRSSQIQVSGTQENATEYIVSDKKREFESFVDQGSSFLNLQFFKNTFDYSSPNNAYAKTFKDSNDADFSGMVRVSGGSYFSRQLFEWGYLLGGGVAYSGGIGYFADNNISKEKINLWTLPVDAGLTMGLNPTEWLKLSAQFGPSMVMLIQHRSDLDRSDNRKRLRQWSPGYFAEASVLVSLGKFIPSLATNMYEDYAITQYYLGLSLRTQGFSNFKSDSIEISGTSLGLNLTFEYL